MDNFIGVYENLFTDEFCDEAVKLTNLAIDSGYGANRKESEEANGTVKDDNQLFMSSLLCAIQIFPSKLHEEFIAKFWGQAYADYADKYSALVDLKEHHVYGIKIQKTKIGGGYHIWHSEHSNGSSNNRILAFTLYLNDVEEGGETEFLYQHKRIPAKKGTLAIFPAGFTHTHRGNPPLSNEKYIITGWVEY